MSVTTSVWSSGAVTASADVSPSIAFSYPATMDRASALGLSVSGSTSRRHAYTKSWAVTALPSVHLASVRSWNV